MNKIFKYVIIFFLSLFLFDYSAFQFFPEIVQKIAPSYKNAFGRGYPRNHFIINKDRGFDINPNYKTSTSVKPPELGYYEVWGNEIGCFDHSIQKIKKKLKKIIYLAGDSFTWGYSPFDKKFGYILEKKINSHVLKCGVSHTGQAHQFSKFQEIFNKGYKSDTVIVNITPNDIHNDYFFPHSTVINGFMIENLKWCSYGHDKISWEYTDPDILKKIYKNKLFNDDLSFIKLKNIIRNYSASIQILNKIFLHIKNYKIFKTKSEKIRLEENFLSTQSNCNIYFKTPYGFRDFNYKNSNFAKKNRTILKNWILHSKKNNYRLIFSFIGGQLDVQEFIYEFAHKNIEVLDFSKWEIKKNLNRKSLYWKNDGHFNFKGNEEYANFLIESISEKNNAKSLN